MKIRRDIIQGSKEWHEKKLGVVTGTVLAGIMGTPAKRQDTLHEIVGERLITEIDMEHLYENPMIRGTRLEPEALEAFEYVTGKKVERVGFIESDESEYMGYSPDAIVLDCDETEDVEVKCPLVKNYMEIVLSNKVPKEYDHQITQAFVVNLKLQKRYFVAYHPGVTEYPIHIIEITRESILPQIVKAFTAEKLFLMEVEELLQRFNK